MTMENRKTVMNYALRGGGRAVRVDTDTESAMLHPSPLPGNYLTVISVYRILEPKYEAGPVPGSLW